VALNANTPTNFPLQEVGETVASVVSPSYELHAILRESKQGTSTRRFVEIWSKNRIEVSLEVSDFHQAFYLDGKSRHLQAAYELLMKQNRKLVYARFLSLRDGLALHGRSKRAHEYI
jgi:hypothetical protein